MKLLHLQIITRVHNLTVAHISNCLTLLGITDSNTFGVSKCQTIRFLQVGFYVFPSRSILHQGESNAHFILTKQISMSQRNQIELTPSLLHRGANFGRGNSAYQTVGKQMFPYILLCLFCALEFKMSIFFIFFISFSRSSLLSRTLQSNDEMA